MQRIAGSRTPHLGPVRRSLKALSHEALLVRLPLDACSRLAARAAYFDRFVRGAVHGRRCGWVAWPSASTAELVFRGVCFDELAHANFENLTRLREPT